MEATETPVKAERVRFHSNAMDQIITVRAGMDSLTDRRGHTLERADPGFYARFESGSLDTDLLIRQAKAAGAEDPEQAAQEAIDFIRTLPQYGVPGTGGTGGIFEEEAEEDPTIEAQLTRIAGAAARKDLDELAIILDEERSGYNRPIVISAAESNLTAQREADE